MSSSSCNNATVLQDGNNAKCAPALNVKIHSTKMYLSSCKNATVLQDRKNAKCVPALRVLFLAEYTLIAAGTSDRRFVNHPVAKQDVPFCRRMNG